MKKVAIAALALGLLIAMLPAALAFQPVRWTPPYGQANKEKIITGTKAVQFQYMHANYQIKDTISGTKWGSDSLRKRITLNRSPGSYKYNVQNAIERQKGPAIFKAVDLIEGKPGATKVTMSSEAIQ